MDALILAIFVAVYAGMVLGEIPGLALDRSGIALLGAIAILAAGGLSLEEAWVAIDPHTLALLFALMVISAQLRLGGFYKPEPTMRVPSTGFRRPKGWGCSR